MEEDTLASTEISLVKVVEDTDRNVNPIKVTNGDVNRVEMEGKKEEEEATLDGEFIKIEKLSSDAKDGSQNIETKSILDDKSSVIERSTNNSSPSREFLDAQEKVKELEIELESIARALKHSESENNWLKDEVSRTKEKLEESQKKYEDLELNHKKLQEKITEAEERYNLQLNSLKEALQAQDTKQKELVDVNEAFEGLNLELESSRKKMQELEKELQLSVGEAHKFEEMYKKSGSHAESETNRALEFERLLEIAKFSAKENEDQMAFLQQELKGLYEKVAENQKVETVLNKTTAELSVVLGELEHSKSQVADIEKRLASKESLINELTQELDMRKASESQVKEDFSAVETMLSSTKDSLQAKVSELEEIKLKLKEEVTAKELVEVGLKKQEAQVSLIQEELAKATKEKEALENAVADLSSNTAQMKELCSDLEAKLQLSDENFCKADSLLSQALANSADLEQKLRSLEELHHESGFAVTTATQKNLELEAVLRASNAAVEEVKSQLSEMETCFITAEQGKVELEQQLNLIELKSHDAERELREFSEKISELNSTLGEVEKEKQELSEKVQEYEKKITQMESENSHLSARASEIELELKNVAEKCASHEGRANSSHQRSLELEDLIQISHSKVEEAGKKVSELELLLVAANYRIQELEEQISTLEKKCGDSEEESMKHSKKVSELESELEAFQSKASSLKISLQMANEKEKELTECLNVTTEEKRNLEDASKSSTVKHIEAENLLEVLRNELNLTQQQLESIKSDLNDAGTRESQVMEKLKSAVEQLEQQGRVLEKATARSSELESFHESLTRDLELKLQEAISNFTSRDSEAKSLYEKLKAREDQLKIYEEQIAEAAVRSAFVKEELDRFSVKLDSSESTNEELKNRISESEDKAAKSISENELLVETNVQLKSKVDELQELLSSAYTEKESTCQQLASHLDTIAELTDQHSRASELHLAAEARISQKETQLQEAIRKFTQLDSETKEVTEKLYATQGEKKLYEEQAHEASALAETRKIELERTLLKLKDLESFIEELHSKSNRFEKEREGQAEANLKLTEELATYESKLNDLQTKLSATFAERDEVIEQLHSLKKAMKDLTQQSTSEGQKLQVQISTVMDDNNLLNEKYQNAKKELQTLKSNEEALKAEMEIMKAEIGEKSTLKSRSKELEEQLAVAEARFKEEVESVRVASAVRETELTSELQNHLTRVRDTDLLNEQVLQLQKKLHFAQTTIDEQKEAGSQKELERDAALKHSIQELEDKNKTTVLILEKKVKELEQKLELVDAKSKEKDVGGSPNELKDGIEMKSRDIGSTISTLSKRKSKKKLEGTSSQSSASLDTHTHTTEASSNVTFKFILGVALVSVIIGIVLGKRY